MSSNIREMRSQVREAMSDIREFRTSILEVNRALSQYLALGGRAGLPQNMVDAIRTMQRAYHALMTLYRGILMVYTTTGPIGWILGGAAIIGGGMMLGDMFYDGTRGY